MSKTEPEMQKLFVDSEKNSNYTDEMDNSFFAFRPRQQSSVNLLDVWFVVNIVFAVFFIFFASVIADELFYFLLIFETLLLALVQIDVSVGYSIHFFYQSYMTVFFLFLYTRPELFGKYDDWMGLGLINESGVDTTIFYFVNALALRWLISLIVMFKILKFI